MPHPADGASSKLTFDFEDIYKTARGAADRKPWKMPINTCDLHGTQPLAVPATIRGDRNPDQPFQQFRDVSGNIVVPIDFTAFPRWLAVVFGLPLTQEAFSGDLSLGGTITISAGTGSTAWSIPQTDPLVSIGDRVFYSDPVTGVTYTAVITALSAAIAAVGDITLTGQPAINDTFTAVFQVFTFVAAATTSTEITIGADAEETIDNAVLKVNAHPTGTVVTASKNGIDKLRFTNIIPGVIGNSTPLTESMANATANGGGFLGGTTLGVDQGVSTTLSLDRAATTPAPNITAAPLLEIRNNFRASAATVTIATDEGVAFATFNAAPSAIAGDQIIYNYAGGETRRMYIVEGFSSTVYTVVDETGLPPVDGVAFVVEAVERRPYWYHTFTIDPTANLPSFILETAFLDLDVPLYFLYLGCKIDTMEISVGGDGELTATFSVKGAIPSSGTVAYDAGLSPPAFDPYTFFGSSNRFEMFDAAVLMDVNHGNTVNADAIKTVKFNFGNKLDPSAYTINDAPDRRHLPEGITDVSFNINALFEDATLLDIGEDFTESDLQVEFVNTGDGTEDYRLFIRLAQVKIQRNDPTIAGPEGVILDLNGMAFKSNTQTGVTAMYVQIRNRWPSYAF